MRKSIFDLGKNLAFNKERWGNRDNWEKLDNYGTRWGAGYQQANGEVPRLADNLLKPFLPPDRYDLKILELSPGSGRFTAELIRYAKTLDLIDMNSACLDLCKERFKMYAVPIRYFQNDGQSCEKIVDQDYDLIACFDSMVHMHPDIIESYVSQLGERLKPGGILWLDHSGKGARDAGHRTDMTAKQMAEHADFYGLEVVAQRFRNDHDCISVIRRLTPPAPAPLPAPFQ